jgi:hypothetical protein
VLLRVAEVMHRKVAKCKVAQHCRHVARITYMRVHIHAHFTCASMKLDDGKLCAVDPNIASTSLALWQIASPTARKVKYMAMHNAIGRQIRGVANIRVLCCPMAGSKCRTPPRCELRGAVVVCYRGHRVYKESRRALNGHIRHKRLAIL